MIPVFWQRGRDLTARAPDPDLGPPDLIVWPETSLPVLLERSDAARVQLSVAAGGAPVLIGAQRVEGFAARNSLALVDGGGALASVYDKHHLVPFGNTCPSRALRTAWASPRWPPCCPVAMARGTGRVSWTLGRFWVARSR